MNNQNKFNFLNKKISTRIGILIIVICVFIFGGILAWQYYEMAKEKVETPGVEGPEGTVKDETADWETYRNEEYGYEMKYPKDWHVFSFKALDVFSVSFLNLPKEQFQEEIDKVKKSGKDIHEHEFENIYKLDILIKNEQIDNYLERQELAAKVRGMNFSKEKIRIGKNEVYKMSMTTTDEAKKGSETYYKTFFNQKNIYLISTGFPRRCNIEECEPFNSMLSTFRFLE